MTVTETTLSGKEQAKLNKRKSFYSKLERQLNHEKNGEKLFPIMLHKKTIFPEYDDLVLVLDGFSEKLKNVDEESKGDILSMPDLDEGYFLKQMSKKGFIELFKEEVYENADGTIRKGSTGSIDDYKYQAAYNLYMKVTNETELLTEVGKEKENPTEYNIKTKTKKLEPKKYIKTYRYPRRRKR